MSDAAGYSRFTFLCGKCGKRSHLNLPTKIKDIRDVPDPFEAECQWCHCNATYPKDAIKIATDIGPA